MGRRGRLRYAASPVSRARRITLAAAAALLGTAALSACTGASSYAVVVNGTTISASTLKHDLDALGSNSGFVTAYDGGVSQATAQGQSDLFPVFATGTANRSYTQGFTAIVLNTDIQSELVHAEVVRRNIVPSAADIAASTAGASQQFPNDASGKSVFSGFPAWFQQEYKVRTAEQTALNKALGAVASDTAAVTAFYQQNPQDFIATQCVSHILVKTEAEAVHIRAAIVKGATFADQARHYSTDTGSAIKGGDLGCAAPGSFVAPFERVAETIAVNQLSDPVHSTFGWHLIEVRSRQIQPLNATISGQIQQFLKQESPVTAFVTAALKTAKVAVNPAYGSWDPLLHGVAPPIAPPVTAGAPTTAPPVTQASGATSGGP